MYQGASVSPGSESTGCHSNTHDSIRKGTIVERLSRSSMQVMSSALQRRSRLQRQQEISDCCESDGVNLEDPDTLTPAMRKKYLKDLLSNSLSSGLSSVFSSQISSFPSQQDTDWALYPMEHAWMLSAIEGNYETILQFVSLDPQLLTRRDFISGYSVLHWLAKRGQDEILLKLLRHAETQNIPVNVNLRGSGGLTPLHVASMQKQFMVIKLLVGAFGANIDVMDYSGRRAWQYLQEDAPQDMKELLGMWDDEHNCGCDQNPNKNLNNNCTDVSAFDELDIENDVKTTEQLSRTNSWRFGSIRKMLNSFSLFGSKT